MTQFQFVRIVWDYQSLPLPVFTGYRMHTLHVGPEPGHPFGRKGYALSSAWQQLTSADDAGMLVMDGDVAADPADLGAMWLALDEAPGDVHTAPVKLWPSSTTRPDWVWGHWADEPSQDLDECEPARHFTFNLTYLPRRLIEACEADGLAQWAFPRCDALVSGAAFRHGVPVHVVHDAAPTHVPVTGWH